MRLIVITFYFGKLPWYLQYFLHSCGYNPSVDFCIITDDTGYPGDYPSNVRVVYKRLDEVQAQASDRLGFPVNIGNGYKCCDLKPAYGYIFGELIAGYDFWG